MRGVSKILVPVNGSRADADSIELACLVARKHRAHVEAIYVIAVRRSLPLDADVQEETERGENILEAVEQTAQGLECPIETSLLQARDAGAAIVDEAVQTSADVIVMGLPYMRRFGEYELGPTASYVLKNAPCQVWIVRQAVGA